MRTEFLDEPAETGFRHVAITPHFERFRLRVLLPDGWIVADLPAEEPDFSQSAFFAPLAVCVAQFAALVFSVAARPRYEDGTVYEWAAFLLSSQGMSPESVGPARVGPFDAVEAVATQASDGGPMRMRLYFFEDGGTLYHVSALAPAALRASADPTFDAMLASLDFAARSGPTALLHPEMQQGSTSVRPDGGDASRSEPPATDATGIAEPPRASSSSTAGVPGHGAVASDASAPDEEPTYASLALADRPATLDPGHPVNARIRDAGAGLVPTVLAQDAAARRATVGAGALRACFGIPFGWHVIDDGRRTLVFDAENRIQVNLTLVDPEGGSDDDVLAAVLREYRATYPDLQHLELTLAGMRCLAFRGVRDGDTLLDQAFLVRRAPDGLVLKVRVTGLPEDMARAMDLAGRILRDLEFAA
jgi:hypothetical protein